MNSLWNDEHAAALKNDPKKLRVYSSRLLGSNSDLVLHGGGNTSVKLTEKDFFGNDVDLLFVKGSGWDLATIEVAGFTPVKIEPLRQLAQIERLSDRDMVNQQRCVTTDPAAPDASVEAILHAIIPHRYVDHTHADSIIAITNTPGGEDKIRQIYGDRVLIVPYVMPGFVLARKIYEMTKSLDWYSIDGLVLMNHGLFTFADDAKTSYEATIRLVTQAEEFLEKNRANVFAMAKPGPYFKLSALAELRHAISSVKGSAVILHWDASDAACGFSQRDDINSIATQGPVTPDHSIRTKRIPMIWRGAAEQCLDQYVDDYRQYFANHATDDLTCLEPTPRWVVWPGHGLVSVGGKYKEARIVGDIAEHTAKVIQQAEAIGGWQALPPEDIFAVEYWELEQAKLKKQKSHLPLQGKIALVTGAASGIGAAAAKELHRAGAALFAVDIDSAIESLIDADDFIGKTCDVCDQDSIAKTIKECIAQFGGLDIVVSNAGTFSQGCLIEDLNKEEWEQSLDVNLNQHKNVMQACYPILRLGIEPTLIVIGSKNVAAPGPGAAAYSVAKAGLNQLARVAALEWGQAGIRVNIIHPDSVFDTGIWANGVLQQRAERYSMSVEQYMSRNILGTPIESAEVGRLIATVAGPAFAKTTGAQIPIDGGNDRVI